MYCVYIVVSGVFDSHDMSVTDTCRTMHLTATNHTANTSCWKDQTGRLQSLGPIHLRCWNGVPRPSACLLHSKQNLQTVGRRLTTVFI